MLVGCRNDRPTGRPRCKTIVASDRPRSPNSGAQANERSRQQASASASARARHGLSDCRHARLTTCADADDVDSASRCRMLLQTTQHCFSVICSRAFHSITDMQLVQPTLNTRSPLFPNARPKFGAPQRRNFDLKSGGTKFEAPKAPRIETPKASRGVRNGEGVSPSPAD